MFDQLTVRKQLKADGILPRQSLRHADLASDANAVDAIIQALDDNSLIPAAAKGTEGQAATPAQKNSRGASQICWRQRTGRNSTQWS